MSRPSRKTCCNEHTRAELARRGLAEAGKGLPAIKTGMPLPAGTGLSRRSFMARAGALAATVYGARLLDPGAYGEGIARAAGANSRVLVSIFFDGGIDALSVLAPVNDPKYQSLRSSLRIDPGQGSPWTEDPRLHWHPVAEPLNELHQEGKVTVFPAIGYSSPDQSHFTSRHDWEVGALDPGTRTGWLGRLLDGVGSNDNPIQGLALDGSLAPSLATAKVPVAAMWGPSYDLWTPGVWGDVEALMFDSYRRLGAKHERSGDAGLRVAGRVARQTSQLRKQMAPFSDQISPPVPYPDDGHFPESLAGLAAMLGAGLPIRCAALSAPGGYDTHDNQEGEFRRGLKETCDSVLAFQRDLEARGLDDRVVTLLWSEFGRRPEENGSAGTDHGAGGCAFLVGSKARGKMVGEWTGLGKLDADDNLRNSSDFRAVYCSLLEQWFGRDAAAVIPGAAGFGRPALIA
jgi:uncharacterized protein (DUF1501 family)